MSPSAKAASKENDTKPSPEECEPPTKRVKLTEEEPRKLPPEEPTKSSEEPRKLPPVPDKKSEEEDCSVGLIRREIARAVRSATRSLPKTKEAADSIRRALTSHSYVELYFSPVYTDCRDLAEFLTPEQLKIPHVQFLVSRLEQKTQNVKQPLANLKRELSLCREHLEEIEKEFFKREKLVAKASDRLYNSGLVNYPVQQALCHDYRYKQIFLGDTVLATLPEPYGLSEAVVVQLGANNFVYITPKKSGRTFCWLGDQLELVPERRPGDLFAR